MPPDPAVFKVADANSSSQMEVRFGTRVNVGFTKLGEMVHDSIAVSDDKHPALAVQFPVHALISISVRPLANMFCPEV